MNVEMQHTLSKLDSLVSKKGFVYALIMALIEDESIAADYLDKRNNMERLSNNEIMFLWSLIVNKENIWHYPDTVDELYSMRCEISRLMEELHFTFFAALPRFGEEPTVTKLEDYKPHYDGASFQEAIFYSGGDLYDEEYIYYTKRRFVDDSQWLSENRGYHVDSFCDIVNGIKQTIGGKIRRFRFLSLPETFEERLKFKPADQSGDEFRKNLVFSQFLFGQDDTPTLVEFCDRIKDAISFTKEDLAGYSDLENYLKVYCLIPSKDCNEYCKEPGDYSILMSSPIIVTPEGHYLLAELHQLYKSLYDVPRYWLNEQLDEHKKVKTHIGDFSERQSLKVLECIFGKNCYSDIIIYKGKQQLTDIDVLCIWKDYALCFQIKSKGLTLSSRKGNIDAIRSDFKKSFQAAYRQGVKCRDALLTPADYSFVDKKTGQKFLPPTLKEVYIICETSDEYPSLTHQMTVMLERKESEPEALAVNLFDLDLLGKYLNEPFYFVHYIHNRLKFYGSTRTDVETNCLSAYTYNRLYLDGSEYDRFMFDNSFAKWIDAELLPQYARQEEVKIDYSLWRDATFDKLIKEIDSLQDVGLSPAIMNLLNFSRDDVKQIGQRINDLLQKGQAGTQEYYNFCKGEFGFSFVTMEMGGKKEVYDFMKAVSIKGMKSHNAQNWLTIAHFLGSASLVGTLAYVLGK